MIGIGVDRDNRRAIQIVTDNGEMFIEHGTPGYLLFTINEVQHKVKIETIESMADALMEAAKESKSSPRMTYLAKQSLKGLIELALDLAI